MIARLARLWPDKKSLVRVGVLHVLSSVLQGVMFALLIPILRALLADEPRFGEAWRWIGLAVLVAIGYSFFAVRARNEGVKVAGRVMHHLQHSIGKHLAKLPLGWFTGNRVGRIGRDVAQSTVSAAGIALMLAPQIIAAVITPATVVVVTFFLDWRMAIAFLVAVPVALGTLKVVSPTVRSTQQRLHAASTEAAGRAVEYAQAQSVLRSTGRVHEGYAQLESALDEERQAYRSTLSRLVLPEVFYVTVVQAGFAAVLVLGVYLALGGELAVPEVVTLLVLAARFIEPLALVANLFGAMRQADVALQNVEDLLNAEPLPEPVTGKLPADASIELENVSFGYNDTQVLRDISIKVAAGGTLALVGPSGSGKTTITRLIARFWDVNSGAVRIGGVDVRDIPYTELTRRIATVFQDVYLFDGTIEENVRLARPDASDEEVRAVAVATRLDEVVERLPNGWSTRVGEGGSLLSGGERQRVSIARAILKDAPIVLLDEATAAIDPENEALIQDALLALTRDAGRTVVAIAHRLSTVVAADEIVVLDNGGVAERGGHEQLLAAGGRYADFWRERSRAQGWRIARADR